MTARRRGAALLALIALAAEGLGAQAATASVAAGAVAVRFAEQGSISAATLTPAFAWRSARVSLAASASLSQFAPATWARQGTAVAAWFTPVSPQGFLGELGGSAGGSSFSDGAATAQGLGTLRGYWLRERYSVWLGGGAGAMYDGAAWRSVRQGEVGASWVSATAALTLAATPSVTDDTIRYGDLLAQYSTGLRALDVSLALGGRVGAALPIPGGDQRLWGSLGVTAWLAPRTSLVAGVGAYPVDVTQGFPAGEFASLSLRLGAARSAQVAEFARSRTLRREWRRAGVRTARLTRAGATLLELRVRATDAQRVEVSGDFTGWAAVPLVSQGNGWWSGRFPWDARVVEYVLRVDGGAWVVPPGADAAIDEFGGRVGRVVLP